MARKSGRDNSAKILRNDSLCSVEHNEMTIRHLHPGFKDSCSQRRSKGRVYLQFLAVRAEKPTILSRLLATLKKKPAILLLHRDRALIFIFESIQELFANKRS